LTQNVLLRHSVFSWLLLLLVHEFLFAAPYILLCTCACVMKERETPKKRANTFRRIEKKESIPLAEFKKKEPISLTE